MSGPDRRKACEEQARLCRLRAAADPARRNYWISEAAKWEQRALDEIDGIAIAFDSNGRFGKPNGRPPRS